MSELQNQLNVALKEELIKENSNNQNNTNLNLEETKDLVKEDSKNSLVPIEKKEGVLTVKKYSYDDCVKITNNIIDNIENSITNMTLSKELLTNSLNTLLTTIDNTDLSFSSFLYNPISIPIGTHHLILKDGNIITTQDSNVICNFLSNYDSMSDIDKHRMMNYKEVINTILWKNKDGI